MQYTEAAVEMVAPADKVSLVQCELLSLVMRAVAGLTGLFKAPPAVLRVGDPRLGSAILDLCGVASDVQRRQVLQLLALHSNSEPLKRLFDLGLPEVRDALITIVRQ